MGSFGEAIVPLDKGEYLRPSIFSHDERRKDSISRFERWARSFLPNQQEYIRSYSYTYPKLVWYQENQPELHAKIWKVLSWADFLVYRLSGVAATNYCHANRTLLFDLWNEKWSEELFSIGGLDGRILADTIPPGTLTGTVLPEMATKLGLTAIKIIVVVTTSVSM